MASTCRFNTARSAPSARRCGLFGCWRRWCRARSLASIAGGMAFRWANASTGHAETPSPPARNPCFARPGCGLGRGIGCRIAANPAAPARQTFPSPHSMTMVCKPGQSSDSGARGGAAPTGAGLAAGGHCGGWPGDAGALRGAGAGALNTRHGSGGQPGGQCRRAFPAQGRKQACQTLTRLPVSDRLRTSFHACSIKPRKGMANTKHDDARIRQRVIRESTVELA